MGKEVAETYLSDFARFLQHGAISVQLVPHIVTVVPLAENQQGSTINRVAQLTDFQKPISIQASTSEWNFRSILEVES